MSIAFRRTVAGALFSGWAAVAAAAPLTLAEAERLAVENDPITARYKAEAAALGDQAVADGQLPDPKLRLAFEGVPVDTFALDQEAMTQFRVAVMQELPRGDSRHHMSERTRAEASATGKRAQEQSARALRAVRSAYLDTWYQVRAAAVLAETRGLLARTADITAAQYGAGRDNRQEVLAARLEVSLLDDRVTEVKAAEAKARAELARWVGTEAAGRALESPLAAIPAPDPLAELLATLDAHPRVRAAAAMVTAGERGVDLARQAYKPGIAFEIGYGKRFGEDPDGEARADLMSAGVTVDLPLFAGKRQDRRLAASQHAATAARLEQDDVRRDLRAELEAEHAAWRRLEERLDRYRREVLPQAEQNAEAAEAAYRSRITPFTTLLRAQTARIESRLQALRLETDAAQARANLAYFRGAGR